MEITALEFLNNDTLGVMYGDVHRKDHKEMWSVPDQLDPRRNNIEAFDLHTLESKWRYADKITQPRYVSILKPLPQGVAAVYSDRLVVLDEEGKLVVSRALQDQAVDMQVIDDENIEVISADGSCSTFHFAKDTEVTCDGSEYTGVKERIFNAVYFPGDLFRAVHDNGAHGMQRNFYVQNAAAPWDVTRSIVKYQEGRWDHGYKQISLAPFMFLLEDWTFFGSYETREGHQVLFYQEDKDSLEPIKLCAANVDTRQTWQNYIPGEGEAEILGISPDGRFVNVRRTSSDGAKKQIFRLDMHASNDSVMPAYEEPSKFGQEYILGSVYFEDKLYLFGTSPEEEDGRREKNQLWIHQADLSDGETRLLTKVTLPPLYELWHSEIMREFREQYPEEYLESNGNYKYGIMDISFEPGTVVVDEENRAISFCVRTAGNGQQLFQLVRFNVDTGKVTSIPLGFEPVSLGGGCRSWNTNCFAFNRKGTRAVFNHEQTLYVVDRKGKNLFKLPADGVAGVCFTPDGNSLLVAEEAGYLSRYDAKTGAQLGRIPLFEATSQAYRLIAEELRWEFLDNETLLLYNSGFTALRVDLSNQSLAVRSAIDWCFDDDEENDRYLICERFDGRSILGSFPCYEVDQLAAQARAVLGE